MHNYTNWISQQNSELRISQVSIPGTHNSGAFFSSLPAIKCQNNNIETQLKHGIRFFDIRLGKIFLGKSKLKSNKNSELQVVHDLFPVKPISPLKFSEVLQVIYTFLDQNQDEVIILSLKQEGYGKWDNENDEFANLILEKYINKNKDQWYLKNDIPKLKECRGKIILFRRFDVKNKDKFMSYGFNAFSWTYNTPNEDHGTFQVQDNCDINSNGCIHRKIEYIKNLIQIAVKYNSNNYSGDKLFVNFCSASNFFNIKYWPHKIAEEINKSDITNVIQKGTGIIIVDFASIKDWNIVKKVIESNYL